MEYAPTKEKTKVIRKALTKLYGRENVSVRSGRGTAASWVEARVDRPKPADCYCDNNKPGYCHHCSEVYKNTREQAESEAYKAMSESGMKFSTYYSDDGYNTQRDNFLLQVSLI